MTDSNIRYSDFKDHCISGSPEVQEGKNDSCEETKKEKRIKLKDKINKAKGKGNKNIKIMGAVITTLEMVDMSKRNTYFKEMEKMFQKSVQAREERGAVRAREKCGKVRKPG